jgi:hypothetical protein
MLLVESSELDSSGEKRKVVAAIIYIQRVALDLLVFLPRISIQSSPSEPPRRHLSLVAVLLLSSLPLLLCSDLLLTNPPMSEENPCRRLNVTPNSLHILLGCHPLYFLL